MYPTTQFRIISRGNYRVLREDYLDITFDGPHPKVLVGNAGFFPMMSDSSSRVSRISDSMALWYRNMGGMVFDASIQHSIISNASWVQCGTPHRQGAGYIRQLLMGDPSSPWASASVHDENEQFEEDFANTLSWTLSYNNHFD